MLLHIPNVLSGDLLAQAHQLLSEAPWQDGRTTTGIQSAQVKHNLQLVQTDPKTLELAKLVLSALNRNALFFSAALPNRIHLPMFNCYQGGMHFGNHVDNAVRRDPLTQEWVRTDVSCTLFLNEPDQYEGGELIIDDTYGSHSVKLPAGDMILYPSTSVHRVEPVTEGQRVACFFWTQSLVRDANARSILFEMDAAISSLRQRLGESDETVKLTSAYHNLLRQWSEA